MPSTRELQIAALVSKWKPRLLLDQWAVLPVLHSEPNPDPKTMATMDPHSRYTDARMDVYPEFWGQPVGARRVTVVHELLHIPTNPIREVLTQAASRGIISEKRKDDLIESLVEYFAKVVYRAYSRNNKDTGGYL